MNHLMNMNKNQLLRYLGEVSFAMYDTALFLDTHPEDEEAMAYFQQMKNARKMAKELYSKKYGPLCLDDVDCGCTFDWAAEPLPWE